MTRMIRLFVFLIPLAVAFLAIAAAAFADTGTERWAERIGETATYLTSRGEYFTLTVGRHRHV